ncbi:uncharacterized protein PV09_04894 [Verruconis gallopava]|uniref:2,5-diamino-6-ribosylamino-4(3H)-pyrimidinone 5'-phosphate reductase n=1 Tax=Verruconis gallopava TaxID=253628 RepID=A0A0D1YTV3_9PEZI|nr:uncharacterized protein PV09_04894 [Verruconis gallopava]KIW04077.1 hypothetical protein PV09_04894 [Verruconis gallopava]
MAQQGAPARPRAKEALMFPASSRAFIDPYLPTAEGNREDGVGGTDRPFVTLTYAQSLDSKLALAPGAQTALSGPETKAMTHYLRSRHDAILVGAGTAMADDPALNCRLAGVGLDGQPRPVVVDARARWSPGRWPDGVAACMALAFHGTGKGPWILTSKDPTDLDPEWVRCAERCSGAYITVPATDGEMDWQAILAELGRRGVDSVMVEGGAKVINALLQEKNLHLVDAVIVTIAPVWLGDAGVNVSPPALRSGDGSLRAATSLAEVRWQQFGQDVVMCGKIKR